MIRRPIRWFRKRRRAIKVGDIHSYACQSPVYWYDPETGDVWLANHRYINTVVVESEISIDNLVSILERYGTMYVHPDELGVTEADL